MKHTFGCSFTAAVSGKIKGPLVPLLPVFLLSAYAQPSGIIPIEILKKLKSGSFSPIIFL
jgi:hypothetical protein